ncbi:MAG: ABC transporter ATP-binding protein [Desulfovibrionaceae bacterium]|nr:ABC transporter ATP-binding protein [Desulfovibrionaceae bacterium]MDD4951446.1 ABC transporter ATP-binding protein [Desulfovibrionaceae bacterium]
MNPGRDPKAVLAVHGAAKFYGRKLVFRDVSCSVRPGEILLVAGDNGAGKSTLLRIMAGLSRPSAGRVTVAAPAQRTAYLGHATFIYPGLTALANLRFWARMYGLGLDRDELVAVLDRVGLAGAAEERAGSFSRGMAQRLNLARVLMVRPRMVFLDEPGTGLDARSLAVLRADIAGLREDGAAVVWVSHQLREDAALADFVLCLARAGVDYYGPAAGFDPGPGPEAGRA